MKLPEDKNERTKILALIAVGVIAVLYGIVAGIIKPIIRKKSNIREETVVLRDNISRAADKIAMISQMNKNQFRALREVCELTENHILHPRLGNYLLDASETVQQAADDLNIRVESIDEVGIMELPKSSPLANGNVFKAYAVRARLGCGYSELVKMFASMESTNPYVCISEINISGNPKDPENHIITINIQWPIWSDEEMATKIYEQLKDMEK